MKKIFILMLSLALTIVFVTGVFAKPPTTRTITFDFNGGHDGTGASEVTFRTNYRIQKLPNAYIKRRGYWFAGFYTKKTKGSFAGVDSNRKQIARKIKVKYYAHWVKTPRYSCTLIKKNGGLFVKGKRRYKSEKTHGRGGLHLMLYGEGINKHYFIGKKAKYKFKINKSIINEAFNKKIKEYRRTHNMMLPHKVKITCVFKIQPVLEDSVGNYWSYTRPRTKAITRTYHL